MRRFARRLSQIARLNVLDKDVPSVVLTRPSQASIFQFDDDRTYFQTLGIKTVPTNTSGAFLSVPNKINQSKNKNMRQQRNVTSIDDKVDDWFDIESMKSYNSNQCESVNHKAFTKEMHKRQNSEMLARTSRFLSIMYAILLIIIGGMCTTYKLNRTEYIVSDIFIILISFIGTIWLMFLHFDILKYKRWALEFVRPSLMDKYQHDDERQTSMYDDESDSIKDNKEEEDGVETISENVDVYDSISMNTAMIFDYYVQHKGRNASTRQENGSNVDSQSINQLGSNKNGIQTGYRFFQGKHSNDFYLKTGMIRIGVVQQIYFMIHKDVNCQEPFKLTAYIVRILFSFYQLFIGFKYSNIIINRFKNLSRFALMHLLGTAIAIWLDSITEEVVDDYVSRKLESYNVTNDHFEEFLMQNDEPFHDHLIRANNCSRLAIVSNQSMSALPYLYPFTIEFNIALASVWYMTWTNIGKVNDKSLFHSVKTERVEDENGQEEIHYRSSGLSLNVDCHSSNRGLFLGLAFLLLIIITIVIFFSTIKKDVYAHFSIGTYSLQISVLTISCLIVIPLAYCKIQQLDVVKWEHRDNAFTIMDDILVLIPIPFYFVHYGLSIVANIFDIMEPQFERANNLLLSVIDLLTIAQVIIQSPFIVDGLRRCANRSSVRFHKPGRELIMFALILNVTLWILNTFELKSVEVHHASHHYFGQFSSMIISHGTLPIMLFYRFHSSVCLSNIWKYAYEKDDT
ncbi:hypothetical protein BLOT_008232 [Blomia tropicalis]|nr:hypothetical protein BLOT_008232 [Blomia tropicalis]